MSRRFFAGSLKDLNSTGRAYRLSLSRSHDHQSSTMRLIFQKKSIMRVDLVDAKTKRPVYALQTHDAAFGTKALLSQRSQNNDGDEADDEIGETTFRDIASDKISVGEIKHSAKKWLQHDGSKWSFIASSGAHYVWSQAGEDYILQGPGDTSEVARLHTDGTDPAKAYFDIDVPKQDQNEVLMSCIYIRLREVKKTESAGGTTLINPISITGSHAGFRVSTASTTNTKRGTTA
ncbi:unnamed protein product [Peniophora sp. CBMAI 1063]|nr:unnamed protein product [Peniophora sp. CBMAI 1063]